MQPNLKDFATSLVVTPPSPATSGTSLTVTASQGVRYPAVPFDAVVHPRDQLPTLDNAERVTVTAIDGDTLTITRAQGSTTAKSIAAGWRLSNGNFSEHVTEAYKRANHTGTQSADTITDGTTNKVYTATEKTKLAAIEAGADVTDAANVDAAGAVMNSDYDANTILAANSDNTPAALTVAESRIVGRATGGSIDDLTPAQVRTIINVEDGADVTDSANVNAAGATMNTDTDVSGNGYVLDEDNMASDSATKLPTQQSVKAYIKSQLTNPNYEGGVGFRPANFDVYFAALENVNTTPVNIVTITDSIGEQGEFPYDKPWPWRLGDFMQRYIGKEDVVGYIPIQSTTGIKFDESTATYSGSGFGGHSGNHASGAYSQHTAYCDRITVLYRISPSGNGATITVRDGGPSGTILGTINPYGSDNWSNMWTSDALTAGEHTIYISVSGGTGVYIEGVYFYNGNYDKGVRVWPADKSGATSQTSQGNMSYCRQFIQDNHPELVLFCTGYNDYDNYDSWMRTQLTTIMADSNTTDTSWGIWIPYILPTQGTRWDKTKVELARTIAADYSLGIVDASIGIPEMGVSEFGLLSDSTHPNEEGNRRLAIHALSILAGDPIGSAMSVAETNPLVVRHDDLMYSKSNLGLGFRANNHRYDDWLTKYRAQLTSPTPATPLKIFTIGDSCSSITNPTFTDHKPWPYLLDILGSQSEVPNAFAGSGGLGWLYAQGDSETRRMTSTQGTLNINTTGGWGSTLTVGQYATQVVYANYVIVSWGRASGGGDLEVRETSSSGTLLATIDTDGTTKGGNLTQLSLTANFFGRYLGTLYFVAAGGTVILEGVHLRASANVSAVVVNSAHAEYTTANLTSTPTRVFDFAENNQPDVTIIMVGVNDGPTNIQSRLTTLIEGLQAVNPDNLIVLVGMYVTGFSLTFTNAMSLIVRDLAEEYNCLFIDVNTAFPRFGQNVLLSGDLLHPSQNGHRAIASLVDAVLVGNPLGYAYNTAIMARSYLPATSSQWPYTSLSVQEALDYIAAGLMWRAGTPEGNLTANVGTLARDTTNGVLYVKATGTGNTGWVKLSTISSTDTLTNKRVTPRVTTITSSATPTINTDNCDAVTITALATAITSMTTNLTGTPSNFDELIIRIKDNGTARAITWGSSFEAKGVALPTTTVISKVLTVAFIYDTVTAKWGCVGSAQEA